MYWGQGCSAAKDTEVYRYLTLLHFQTGNSKNAQNVREDTACRKDNNQQNLSKMITWYCRVYNQITSNVWRCQKFVYELVVDNLQLVLINMLIRPFLNIKVLQGSVAIRLRCDGIFNDHFRYTLTDESIFEIILKVGQNLPKLWVRIKCPVFYSRGSSYALCHSSCFMKPDAIMLSAV